MGQALDALKEALRQRRKTPDRRRAMERNEKMLELFMTDPNMTLDELAKRFKIKKYTVRQGLQAAAEARDAKANQQDPLTGTAS